MDLSQKIQQICLEHGYNGTVLVQDGEQNVAETSTGFRDIEHQIPMSSDVVFRIGSVTKQITAVAILQLIDHGDLKLTDTIDRFVPNVPYDTPITIHHLLSNSSGIPNFDIHGDYEELLASGEFLHRLVQEVIFPLPLHFVPGDRFEYSSSGFILLSHIIEVITNQPYHEYIQTQIFDPLDMKDSGFHFLHTVHPKFSTLYDYQDGTIQLAEPYDMRIASGAGGLFSTASDLSKWNHALIEATILSEKSRDAMFAVQTPINETGGYGYGVISIQFDHKNNQHRAVYHPGNGPGVFAQNTIIDSKIQLILLSNINDGKTFRKTYDALFELVCDSLL